MDMEAATPTVREQDTDVLRPPAPRVLTNGSAMSKDSKTGKWWSAPSSWAVNAA
jgi:hypothetical protein